MVRTITFDKWSIQQFRGILHYGLDIIQVPVRVAFPEIFQFSEDDIFRRGNRESDPLDPDLFRAFERPLMQVALAFQVDVCLEPRFKMNEFEMPPLRAEQFILDDLDGRYVIFFRRECRYEIVNPGGIQVENDVNIVHETRITVDDRSDRARDHIPQLLIVKPRGKDGEEIGLLVRSFFCS